MATLSLFAIAAKLQESAWSHADADSQSDQVVQRGGIAENARFSAVISAQSAFPTGGRGSQEVVRRRRGRDFGRLLCLPGHAPKGTPLMKYRSVYFQQGRACVGVIQEAPYNADSVEQIETQESLLKMLETKARELAG